MLPLAKNFRHESFLLVHGTGDGQLGSSCLNCDVTEKKRRKKEAGRETDRQVGRQAGRQAGREREGGKKEGRKGGRMETGGLGRMIERMDRERWVEGKVGGGSERRKTAFM